MGLEVATYIGQLVTTNPTSVDGVKQGDDHLRLIKAALQATFPSLTFPITFSSVTKSVFEQTTLADMRDELGVPGDADNNTFTGTQRVEWTDSGAAAGTRFDLVRLSSTPAVDDATILLRWIANNLAVSPEEIVYGVVGTRIKDPADGGEKGELYLGTVWSGTLAERLRIGQGVYTPSATGGDKGAETLNLGGALYFNGVGPFAPASIGSAGQVLQSAGAGVTPAFAWPAVIQQVRATLDTVQTGTTTVPLDDTIPQSGEGTEFLTCAITPKLATSVLEIEAEFNLAISSATPVAILALFKDSDADAIAVASCDVSAANTLFQLRVKHTVVAGSTTARTYKARLGPSSAATLTVNGFSSARKFGGVLISRLTIRELAA